MRIETWESKRDELIKEQIEAAEALNLRYILDFVAERQYCYHLVVTDEAAE